MTKIAVFVGSLRDESLNKKLEAEIERMAPEGVEFEHIDFRTWPLFNQDNEGNYPKEIQAAKDIVLAADGLLFVTPEYNRGIPGPLKNAVDWLSRPFGTSPFGGKHAAVTGASESRWGTTFAQTQLKSVLVYLDVRLMGQPELYINSAYEQFNKEGRVHEETEPVLKRYIDTFVARINA